MNTLSTSAMHIAYLAFYGILCLTSLILAVEWGRLAARRAKFLDCKVKELYHDRYMVIATALSLNSVAMAGLAGSRVYAILRDGDYAMPGTYLLALYVVASMLMLAISKFGLVWATHLSRWDAAWILAVVSTILWVTFSFWWVL